MFGERESQFTVAGYVPSIRRDGVVRIGSDQIVASAVVQERELQKQKEVVRACVRAHTRGSGLGDVWVHDIGGMGWGDSARSPRAWCSTGGPSQGGLVRRPSSC